jgi:hypothetical protein
MREWDCATKNKEYDMSNNKQQKHRSRLLNLMLMMALVWGTFTLAATRELLPVEKMFAAYISWGLMIYLLMGFFFARKPSRTIALFGIIAALGAELGRFDIPTMTSTLSQMPEFLIIVMGVSLLSYTLGIFAGWLVESLLKGVWKWIWAKPALT